MNILFLLERKNTILPWFLCPNHHHQLCSAVLFLCSKAHCWGIKKFNINIPECCWWNITCMITSGIRGEQRPSPALFSSSQIRAGLPFCVGRALIPSAKWSFCYESFTDKIHGGNKKLGYGHKGQDVAGNHRGFLQKKVEQFRRGFVPEHSPGQRSFKGFGNKRWGGSQGRLQHE